MADQAGRIDMDGIARLAADQAKRRISIGDILAAMGERSTLTLTLLFALRTPCRRCPELPRFLVCRCFS